ncbi:serine/arginine repetitive matrix protein 1-like [Cloeon dipterum]|uniref:serine/arginine repetitive matrix protein 1-like n=1 Tax=Cloeon dipterum TaxID=197152 RepID=UPI00321F8DCA
MANPSEIAEEILDHCLSMITTAMQRGAQFTAAQLGNFTEAVENTYHPGGSQADGTSSRSSSPGTQRHQSGGPRVLGRTCRDKPVVVGWQGKEVGTCRLSLQALSYPFRHSRKRSPMPMAMRDTTHGWTHSLSSQTRRPTNHWTPTNLAGSRGSSPMRTPSWQRSSSSLRWNTAASKAGTYVPVRTPEMKKYEARIRPQTAKASPTTTSSTTWSPARQAQKAPTEEGQPPEKRPEPQPQRDSVQPSKKKKQEREGAQQQRRKKEKVPSPTKQATPKSQPKTQPIQRGPSKTATQTPTAPRVQEQSASKPPTSAEGGRSSPTKAAMGRPIPRLGTAEGAAAPLGAGQGRWKGGKKRKGQARKARFAEKRLKFLTNKLDQQRRQLQAASKPRQETAPQRQGQSQDGDQPPARAGAHRAEQRAVANAPPGAQVVVYDYSSTFNINVPADGAYAFGLALAQTYAAAGPSRVNPSFTQGPQVNELAPQTQVARWYTQ